MSRKLILLMIVALAWSGVTIAGENTSTGPEWQTNPEPPYKGYPRGWALVSVDELKQLMEQQRAWDNRDTIENSRTATDPKLVIIDVGKPTEHYRVEGHIPGAHNTWRPDYESPEKLFGVRGENLMSREDFQEFLRDFGIDNDSQVVWYDHKYDATRLWWACKLYGLDTRVLDGGFKAWKASGGEVDRLSGAGSTKPGNVVLYGGIPTFRVDTDAVWKCKDDSSWKLWDIRSDAELDGSRKRAKRMGGIAWSDAMLPWKLVHGEDGTFLDFNQLQESYIKANGFSPADHHVFICQSGVRTTQAFFALYLAGFPVEHLHNYDSSWIYWGNSPDTPIVDPAGNPVVAEQ
jgi:thiosulfate/3-mercaptopyruvate sulfurtransferase